MKKPIVYSALTFAVLGLGLLGESHAQEVVLRISVFSAGSHIGTDGTLVLHGTVGQMSLGRASGTTHQLHMGFWYQAAGAAGPLALPTATDDAAATDEDTPVAIDVLTNDADPAGGDLTLVSVSEPAHGSASIRADSITYTPEPDFFGDDSFAYTVINDQGGSATATVTLTINPINDAPRFTSMPVIEALAGVPYTYTARTTDVEGEAIALTAPTRPSWLTVTDNGDSTATLTGTPTNADVGQHPVTLSASDGALSQEQAFTITVTASTLAAPEHVAPEDGAVDQALEVRLQWNGVPGAVSYDVQVDTEAGFEPPFGEAKGVTNTQAVVQELEPSTTYFWRVRAVDASGPGPFAAAFRFTTATNVATEEEAAVPAEFVLHANYPNPFNPTTTIAYDLAQTAEVRLVVYDLFGRAVKTLVEAQQAAGRYEVTFEAEGLASGTYFYRIEAGAFSQVQQLVLLK